MPLSKELGRLHTPLLFAGVCANALKVTVSIFAELALFIPCIAINQKFMGLQEKL